MAEAVVGVELEITVVLKVTPTSTWTENTTVKQIKDQGSIAAMNALNKLWAHDDQVTTVTNPRVTGMKILPKR